MKTPEKSVISAFKENLSMTMQHVIQTLGPIPDDLGEFARQMLESEEWDEIAATGVYLDQCAFKKSYEPLRQAQRDYLEFKGGRV